jgi:hypothetical protein
MPELNDGAYIYVTGTATDVFMGKSGLAVELTTHDSYSNTDDVYKVWGINGSIVSKGDKLKVKGWLKFNRESEKGPAYVSISKPTILEHLPSVAVDAGVPSNTNTFPPVNEDAPF